MYLEITNENKIMNNFVSILALLPLSRLLQLNLVAVTPKNQSKSGLYTTALNKRKAQVQKHSS